jgi:hypothetical protein
MWLTNDTEEAEFTTASAMNNTSNLFKKGAGEGESE